MIFRTGFFLQQLKKNQWLVQEELEKLQLKKLKAIVSHAYNTVPYYHELFKSNGISPADIVSLHDIEKIPVTTKKDIVALPAKKITSSSINLADFSVEETSGTTGNFSKVYRCRKTEDYNLALVMHAMFECGLKLSDLLLVFEDPRYYGKEKKSLLNQIGFLRKEKTSIFNSPQKSIETINQIMPDVIYGYPSTFFLAASCLEKNNILLQKKPRFIITSSEALFSKFRSVIENNFGCSVFDHYGSTEFPRIAWQCSEKKFLHINADSHIVEFLKNGIPVTGEDGIVTVTSLYDFGMPLLRYSLGDVSSSVEEKCSCGRGLPLMNSIEGRSSDFIIASDGKPVSPKFLCYEFDEVKGISQYCIRQKTKGKAIVFVVKGKDFDNFLLQKAVEKIENWLEGKLLFSVEFVAEISRNESKKFRIVSSGALQSF